MASKAMHDLLVRGISIRSLLKFGGFNRKLRISRNGWFVMKISLQSRYSGVSRIKGIESRQQAIQVRYL